MMAHEVLNRKNNDLLNHSGDAFFDSLARRFLDPSTNLMDWVEPAISSTAVNGLLTDVKETGNAYEVHVDVPGIDKSNIQMNYHDGVLNINVHKEDVTDHADKDGNVLLYERNYGTMSRSYQLPNVDESNIKATYKDGVLNITMPKLTESKDSGHHIEIQ